MKLIINIHKEQYEFIKQSMTSDKVKDYHALLYDICERIANGIPLDDVKADEARNINDALAMSGSNVRLCSATCPGRR